MATNILQMNRGDTFQFDFNINNELSENGYYVLQGNDALYFGVMDPNQMFEDALVKKKYTASNIHAGDATGTITIRLETEDTIDLLPGRYYYMIKLKMDHYVASDEGDAIHVESVTTIINKTKFFIFD